MRVICPECFASYQIEAVVKNAVLVCHKCDTEFDGFGNKVVAGDATSQLFQAQEEHAPTYGIKDLAQSGMQKKKQHAWLWMSLILLILTTAGIANHWHLWSHHGVFRGYFLQVQQGSPVLDSDWQVTPDSVHSQWLKRDDGSLALVVEGEVRNLLSIPLPPPEVKVTFITQTGQNDEIIQPITEPASLAVLKASPFVSPAVDKTSVFPLGSRGFILVLEDVPLSTQNIELHALAVQRKGQSKL
ncbi:MAG TPA: hypothetical protein EYP39_07150 [Ghiorsea sp.]|nr:hypothetical protein [Ghiorsea sp.]HIP07475.1 hypothetical protein [Mariprofundaceae bacterium]